MKESWTEKSIYPDCNVVSYSCKYLHANQSLIQNATVSRVIGITIGNFASAINVYYKIWVCEIKDWLHFTYFWVN